MMEKKILRKVPNKAHWTQAGDYWQLSNGTIILACPYCNHISYCTHEIVSLEPLTLRPSVIEHPCDHHFIVTNGEAQ